MGFKEGHKRGRVEEKEGERSGGRINKMMWEYSEEGLKGGKGEDEERGERGRPTRRGKEPHQGTETEQTWISPRSPASSCRAKKKGHSHESSVSSGYPLIITRNLGEAGGKQDSG